MKLEIKGKEYEIKPFLCNKNDQFPFYINITNACNAKCEFCANAGKDPKEINYKELKEILDQIHDKINRFSISGGETMLDPKRIKKVLDILDPYDVKITINTNGKFLKENVELLNKYKNIESIQLSRHHYDDKINNEIFKIETLPLKEIKDIKLKTKLNINCLLIKGYMDSLEKIYEYLEILSKETDVMDVGFISMMDVNQFTKDNFIDYHDVLKDLENYDHVIFNGTNFYLKSDTIEAGLYNDGKRCSCANYIYVAKNKKAIHFYFRYTKQYGHCGKRSLFYDCNGLSEGY